jgi:hypothetical protein
MNYRVLIDGVDYSAIGLVEGLEISRRSDEAISTARVQFMQRLTAGSKFTQTAAIKEWAHIQIVEDAAGSFPRFGGYIAEITRDASDNEKYRADCRCVDYGVLFERKISAQVFTDQTDEAIAIALSVEGGIPAPAENVDTTNMLAEFDARDLTIREALERLCEITGCRWHVDTSKTFRYAKPGLHFAPFNLSDTPDHLLSFPYQMTGFTREFSSAANRMLFLGAPDASGAELRVTRENTASQATYGVIEAVKVDRTIGAASVAQLMLDAELSQRALPRVSGSAIVRSPVAWGQLLIGQMIGIKSALYGIDQNFLIHGVRYFIDHTARQGDGTIKPQISCQIEFGQRESDFVSMMRILARKDAALPEAIIGEDTVIPAENIVGVIGAEHIGGVAAENIEGLIQAVQIGTVSGETITGVIGGPGSTATVYGQSITGVIGGPGSDVDVTAANITGVIVGAQLTDQILDTLRLVGSEMGVVERIPSSVALPALPHLEYPPGSVVLQTAVYGVSKYGVARYGSTLYEAQGSNWVVTSASANLTGIMKAGDIESIYANQIIGLIVAKQIEHITAKQITGLIQGEQIENIEADSIISVNAEAITGPISAQNITVLNAGDITMVTRWVETQIESVNASSITAGTITTTVRMTSPDIDVTSTGEGYRLQINTMVGMKISATATTRTMTLTNSQIKIEATAGDYTLINEAGIDTRHPSGYSAVISALTGSSGLQVVSPSNSITLQSSEAFGAEMALSGVTTSLRLGGTTSWLFVKQPRFPVISGSVSIPGSAGMYFNLYHENGALIGKVPVFP